MLKLVGEDFVKRYCLEYNFEVFKRVRRDIGEIVYICLRVLIEYCLSGKDFDCFLMGVKVVVVFLGGFDSIVMLKVFCWVGFDVIFIMVKFF